ncbi:hypothetical protein BDQ17DRAFT_1389178 [Cyathus striatus]|nr:hypothetical protein BDQ17DRAFT_1389178 [Cyathus striatus]
MGSAKRSQRNGRAPPQLRSRTTRSSRARLLTTDDTTNNTQLLTDQLRSLGLYAAPTLGDGNCLFRALSDQLYGSPSKHPQLRKDICDWIEHHKDRYEPFVEDERGLDVHLRCMRENATYGGHMELSAFAHMTRRNVKVVQPGLVYVIEWAAFNDAASSPPPQDQDDDEGLSGKDRRKQRKERMRAEKDREKDDDNDEEEGEGGTVYVAYHDWEHFSSIRNLRGPHTGLPNRADNDKPSKSEKPPSKKAEAPSEHRKVPKVKLKLSAPPTPSATPAPESRPDTLRLPSDIPLPTSRAASPAMSTSISGSSVPSSSCSTLSSLSTLRNTHCYLDGLPPGSPMKLTPGGESPLLYYSAPESPMKVAPSTSAGRAERSPKRSFDESSASDGEGGGETPALSSPSSSSTSPSPPPPPSSKTKERAHPYQKPNLTQRQRKKLGLPKSNPGPSGAREDCHSRWEVQAPGEGAGGPGEGEGEAGVEGEEEEWKKNGTGRVDVRGFRELKI